MKTALERLVAAVEAETDPDWDCNSYHPSLWSALDVARAALASAAQPADPVTVEAVAKVVRHDEGIGLDWLIEGGISALAVGEVLVCANAAVTDDTGSGEVYLAPAPKAAPAPAAVAEPVAWLHDDPQRYDVLHAEVKDLLVKSRDAAGHLHRPLDKSEHYTIPLYAAPVPAAQRDALAALIEHYGRVEFQRYRVGPDGNSTRWDIGLGHCDLTVSGATLPAAIDAAIAAVNPTQGD